MCAKQMSSIPANSKPGKCAANFVSLSKEQEILVDLAFLSCFDKQFFEHHLEFNHIMDPNIGKTGFLAHHHVVRYHIKLVELKQIKDELDNGSVEAAPHNAKFVEFWEILVSVGNQGCLNRVRSAIDIFIESVHKHNKQFVSPQLLFLASFGECTTSKIVTKMLLEEEYWPEKGTTFKSGIHSKTIDLYGFTEFLFTYGESSIEEMKPSSNF